MSYLREVVAVLLIPTLAAFVQGQATNSVSEKPRVFITDSQSWEIAGGGGGSSEAFGTAVRGGARPQTAEIIKTFGERCPQVLVNNIQQKADYIVLLDHEGGKGYLRRRNKVAVFARQSGDSVISNSTRSLGNSVQDACDGITKHWAEHGAAMRAVASTSADQAKPTATTLDISSTPPDADIELDGAFAGNTPSSVGVVAGEHTLRITKKGYAPWERKIRSSTGTVRVSAELEPAASPSPASAAPAAATAPGQKMVTAAPETNPPTPPQLRPAVLSSTEKPVAQASGSASSIETDGTASITSSPDGTEIFVDSVERGHTPALLKLKPGKHTVQLVMGGYKDFIDEIEVKAGSIVNVSGNLQK